MRLKGRRLTAEGPKREWGFGEGRRAPEPPATRSGGPVSSPSGNRGGAPAAGSFYGILGTLDGFSCYILESF